MPAAEEALPTAGGQVLGMQQARGVMGTGHPRCLATHLHRCLPSLPPACLPWPPQAGAAGSGAAAGLDGPDCGGAGQEHEPGGHQLVHVPGRRPCSRPAGSACTALLPCGRPARGLEQAGLAGEPRTSPGRLHRLQRLTRALLAPGGTQGTIPIPGAKDLRQAKQNLGALGWRLRRAGAGTSSAWWAGRQAGRRLLLCLRAGQ